jgi:hypothetical protein
MSAFAAQERLTREEVERRVQQAWADYSASVRDLEGPEYEDAEAKAWARLQRRLAEIGR